MKLAALAIHVRDAQHALLAFAKALTRDDQRALDVYQEAVLRAIEHLEEIEDATKIQAWLKTTIRNLVYEQHRKSKALSLITLPEDLPEDYRHWSNQNPHGGLSLHDNQAWLASAREDLQSVIPKLTPALAEFVTAVVEDGTRESVCAALNLSPHEYRSYLSRLRKSLIEFGVITVKDKKVQGYIPSCGLPENHPLFTLYESDAKATFLAGYVRYEQRDVLIDKLNAIPDPADRARCESLLCTTSTLYLIFLNKLLPVQRGNSADS